MSNDKVFDRVFRKNKIAVERGLQIATKAVAKETTVQIKTRTRLGGGLSRDTESGKLDGKRKQLEKLSPSYKKQRQRYKANLDSKFTNVGRSNLTATGQMLKSIRSRVKPGNTVFTEIIAGGRRKELDGSSPRLNNKQIQEFVEEKRPFLGLTTAESNKLRRLARDIILKQIQGVNR